MGIDPLVCERGAPMGTVITFPTERRAAWNGAGAIVRQAPASVVILPVVRIERHGDEPTDERAPGAGRSGSSGRRRRRRS